MNSRTSTATVARYLRTLFSHARYPALRALEAKPVLLIAGEKDLVTPSTHSAEIAACYPRDLCDFPGQRAHGHAGVRERVNAVLDDFLSQF
jgi:pimeloyl-ACP methyl ester carboxylesterase